MASNGLVAKPQKTTLIFLNLSKKEEEEISIKIGNNTIIQTDQAKVLGMTVNDSQNWKNHISGTGGVVSKLNQRMYFLRRLKNTISLVSGSQTVYSTQKSDMASSYVARSDGRGKTQKNKNHNLFKNHNTRC